MVNSVDPDQTAPIGAVCSGSTLVLGNYLQQKTSADNIWMHFFLGALMVKVNPKELSHRDNSFGLILYNPVNSYGHVGTVISTRDTFFLAKID